MRVRRSRALLALGGGCAALLASAAANGPVCMSPAPRPAAAPRELRAAGLALAQAAVVHRHGARTPWRVRDAAVTWDEQEVDSKRELPLAAVSVRRVTPEGLSPALTEAEVRTIDHDDLQDARVLRGGALPARLTAVGMEQAVALGERLRSRYIDSAGLVSSNWREAREHVFVRSTSTERTIETVQGVLTGLWPGQIKDNTHAIIRLRDEDENEWGVPNFGSWCPRLQKLWSEGTKKMKADYTKEQTKLVEELREHVNMHVPDKAGAFILSVYRDEFASREAHGKPLPGGTEKVAEMLRRLELHDAERIKKMFGGGEDSTRDEATRLHAGRMLKKIIDSLDEEPDEAHRLVLHSGHDWTILMLLLGIDPEGTDSRTREWPRFCCDLVFERWISEKNKSEEYFRILLNGDPLLLPHMEMHPKFSGVYTKAGVHDALHRFLLAEHEIEEACKV